MTDSDGKTDRTDGSFNRTDLVLSLAFLAFAAAVQYLDPHHLKTSPTVDETMGDKSTAASPTAISSGGWKHVLWRTYVQTGEDRLLAVAAGVVFYGLLALFPAITALVSSYALIADTSTINDHLSFLAGILPAGTFSIVQDQVSRPCERQCQTRRCFSFQPWTRAVERQRRDEGYPGRPDVFMRKRKRVVFSS